MAKSGSAKAAHWAQLSESGTVLGMRLLLLVYRLFGRSAFYLILYPVMVYYYWRKPVARAASQQFLARIRVLEPQAVPRYWAGLRHFMAFGDAILDKFLAWMGRIRRDDVQFDEQAPIAQLDQSGRGGIIVVSHLGNIEVCRALAYRLPGIRLTILVHTRHAAKFNALLSRLAPESPINLLQVTEMTPATAMLLAERVDAGEYVVIAGDRIPVSGELRVSGVSFLGAKALFPQGPFILAALLRCPVMLMFCLKHGNGYRIYLEHFLAGIHLPRKSRQQALDAVLQQYAQRLEHYCRIAPMQWFNFFPFWCGNDQVEQSDTVVDRNNG